MWRETFGLIVFAVLLAAVVKMFFVQAFYIPSESMAPTLNVSDKLFVQKVTYWAGEPQRGDIVVFDDPGGWLPAEKAPTKPVQRFLANVGLLPTGGHLIKRVIGVGGDTVKCCDADGRLVVNGRPIAEGYVLDQSLIKDRRFEVRVRDGYLWVMGDNRGRSLDSVAHIAEDGGGQIAVDAVVGKAWLRVWPMSRFGFLGDTDAFAAAD